MNSRPQQITDGHLRRRAVVYIRQSSPEQVRENIGSTGVQREIEDQLHRWGWSPNQTEVLDEDLGVSGSTPGVRKGFDRLIREIANGHVGVVAVSDSSRLTRNLVDLVTFATAARQNDVLLIHAGQVVDFRDPNSEFIGLFFGLNAVRENRARIDAMRRAKRKKAEAGHASTVPPPGYVITAPGVWGTDPDPQVRRSIQLVFDKYIEIGTLLGVARWLRHAGVRLVVRRARSWIRWGDANHQHVLRILRNEAYAGVYVFGRYASDAHAAAGASGTPRTKPRPVSECIRIPEHHHGYVTPEQWAEIQRRLDANRPTVRPSLGRGEALVQGLLRCQKDNRTIQTFYPNRTRGSLLTGDRRAACYRCTAPIAGDPQGCCQVLAARVDSAIEAEILKILVPPSLEDIEAIGRETLRSHEGLVRAREAELHRIDQAVAEAERAFDQVADQHPHVKARLAERFEGALRERTRIQAHHTANPLIPPIQLDPARLHEIRRLLVDLPLLWRHPGVSPTQRKTIVRTVIRVIYVTPGIKSWCLVVCWVGGAETELTVLTQFGIRSLIHEEGQQGFTSAEIAQRLLAQGVQVSGSLPADQSVTRTLTRLLRLPRPIEAPAYEYICRRYNEGAATAAIARELNGRGFRHLLGSWTGGRADKAIKVMPRTPLPGMEPPKRAEPLGKHVRELHHAGLAPEQIVHELQQRGLHSRRRRPVTRVTVINILWKLGLRPSRQGMRKAKRADEPIP